MAVTYPSEWQQLRFPAKRAELIEYLSEIVSTAPNSDPDFRDFSIDEIVHFFFDDTNLADQRDCAVGEILFDDVEATLVREVTTAIDAVLKQLGDQDSREFLAHTGWLNVRARARIALEKIRLQGVPQIHS